MKKIMFSDKFNLTEAVLLERKTQTRRVIPKDFFDGNWDDDGEGLFYEDCNGYWHPATDSAYAFQKGEIVAIAQSYASIVDELEDPKNFCCMEHWESASGDRAHYCGYLEHPGFTNKMFVSADEMPHQIRITNVRVERLQDISDEDCMKEGILINNVYDDYPEEHVLLKQEFYVAYPTKGGNAERHINFDTPQEAYACLIDKISGKGTFEKNPYVFVYDFELVK